jgi:hypothetical protein
MSIGERDLSAARAEGKCRNKGIEQRFTSSSDVNLRQPEPLTGWGEDMAKLDSAKEELGWLKVLFAVLAALDASRVLDQPFRLS